MKFRAVSEQTKMNYLMWSIKREILKENAYLSTLSYDPTPIMQIVKHYFDAWDPIALLDANSSDDEYEGEARTLTIYITKHLADLEIASLSAAIRSVFHKSFLDEFQEDDACEDIAVAIIHSLQTIGLLG
ncbi:hypothetical protein HQN90_35715 [Paenibacillus alba]|uniref:hypothetical protein n=1 Tax=Paenibacillus alba TaxID=1197127 RepID=UPI00156391C9|nr:hypothetical protein [Paenibacillus alba]NQX71447.1 hypothetical protein [Paenibacillus alba]